MKQRSLRIIRQIVIVGSLGYLSLTLLSWLWSWLLVSSSYCYHRDGDDKFKTACGMPLYPLWKYQSWQHADEFRQPIAQAIEKGCLTETPVRIKVMQYRQETALVWYEGASGSTWLALFHRQPNTIDWSVQERCAIAIINSTTGGSADDIYWY